VKKGLIGSVLSLSVVSSMSVVSFIASILISLLIIVNWRIKSSQQLVRNPDSLVVAANVGVNPVRDRFTSAPQIESSQTTLAQFKSQSVSAKIHLLESLIFKSSVSDNLKMEARDLFVAMLTEGSLVESLAAIGLMKDFSDLSEDVLRSIGQQLCRFQSRDENFELIRARIGRLGPEYKSRLLAVCKG
jgi:hypothetical protein